MNGRGGSLRRLYFRSFAIPTISSQSFRKDGVVVTNYHVISEGSSAVVKLPDGAFYLVDGVLASDKTRDIAVIKAHGQSFRTLTLGNSDRVQVGQEVVAIGNPLSMESTVSNGIVSGIRVIEEEGGKFLQITAPISPGSSGGPLFNMAGEVVGITTAGLKGGENLNFAIPVNAAKHMLLTKSFRMQNFPNESEPKETQSETIRQKPTLEEQKMCSEQADKVLQKHELEDKDYNPSRPTFGVAQHYDASMGICYVRISRVAQFKREFVIEDAFGGSQVGLFVNNTPSYENYPDVCYVQPSGQPKIDCHSETQFHDFVFNYFGIWK